MQKAHSQGHPSRPLIISQEIPIDSHLCPLCGQMLKQAIHGPDHHQDVLSPQLTQTCVECKYTLY